MSFESDSQRIRESITKLVLAQSPHVDEKAIMQAMNTELYDKDNDWNVREVGLSVFESPPKGGDVTVWQVVTHPAELKMWVRIPTHSGWAAANAAAPDSDHKTRPRRKP